jgi:hypothetical protein
MSKHTKYSPVLIGFYVISVMLCFLIFKQSDLTHTYTSSYAYLSGHILDFYDYNKPYMGRNDYLPLMYVIFALWNLPLELLGLLTPADLGEATWQLSTPLEILWSKLMLSTFFLGCVILLAKISRLIDPKKPDDMGSPSLLLATSPIALFAVFIFSQYDVIGVFFTLLGLYAYFQKQFLRFAFFFSVAISFKYFACFIYLPLVLLVEKRLLHLIKFGMIGIGITVLQIAIYWHSTVFQESFFFLAGTKTGDAMHRGKAIYIAIIYAVLCSHAYVSRVKLVLQEREWAIKAILICISAYALMFTLVRWHPQWLIILMPFFSLVTPYIRHQKIFLSYELVAYIAFIWLCVNTWPGNVDVTMAQEGILHGYIPAFNWLGGDVLSPKAKGVAQAIFYIYLFSPIIFWVAENRTQAMTVLRRFAKMRIVDNAVLSSSTDTRTLSSRCSLAASSWRVYAPRVLVGCYFFLVVTLICLYFSS